jgi:hypothetical protein
MRNVAARELQDALAAERVLERFLANSALATNEGSLATGALPFDLHHASHRTSRSPIKGRLVRLAVRWSLVSTLHTGVSQMTFSGVIPSRRLSTEGVIRVISRLGVSRVLVIREMRGGRMRPVLGAGGSGSLTRLSV